VFSSRGFTVYEKETGKKNGIADNTLSRKESMKRIGTENYVNEEANMNASKMHALQRRNERWQRAHS
jgi:hypothetical protein